MSIYYALKIIENKFLLENVENLIAGDGEKVKMEVGSAPLASNTPQSFSLLACRFLKFHSQFPISEDFKK